MNQRDSDHLVVTIMDSLELLEQRKAVLLLHMPTEDPEGDALCIRDGEPWPCATVQALGIDMEPA